MSSQAMDGSYTRSMASSPGPGRQRASSAAAQDPSIRPMRLKVLYTFDEQNKTNCLARWPGVLDIRTAELDESTRIGVIELKTCIQAIVSASPELVAKLGQDYTIYAYDYSEYETPLVGQGMLSWALASSSSTPSAPAHQSRTIVTGRVCRNIMGLFSNGAQETLEVKLRLVPVPTCLQSEYIESMRKYRDLSKVMPEGFDAQAWTQFLQANPNILEVPGQNRSQSPSTLANQREMMEAQLEQVQRLFNNGYDPTESEDSGHQQQTNSLAQKSPRQDHRSPSPAGTLRSVYNRPPTRTASSPGYPADVGRGTSPEFGDVSNDDRVEEGPVKKRAKITKGQWPGKNNFGGQPESLRVAASTAASVRMHQPTAIRPSANMANSLEEPPRQPTPIPNPTNQIRPLLAPKTSGLRRESYLSSDQEYKSPYSLSEAPTKPALSTATSPEDSKMESDAGTPANITSSPPIPRDVSSPTPSSPSLPTLPRHQVDSGFMSGTIDDLFEDDENRPIDDSDLNVASQYDKRPKLSAAKSSKKLTPGEMIVDFSDRGEPVKNQIQKATKCKISDSLLVNIKLNRTASSGTLSNVPVAVVSSDPPRQAKGTLQRAETWSGSFETQQASSDVPMNGECGEARKRPKSRTGSAVRRKAKIQSKLADSISAGEVPPFCENCGTIETPTWRKAWSKFHSGTPELVKITNEDGGVIAWEPVQVDPNGSVVLFRIFKKTLFPTDVGFTEILLCNPCGLWLHNRNQSRPKEYWQPEDGDDGKPKRPRRAKNPRTKSETGGAQTESLPVPQLGLPSSPVDGADDRPQDGEVQREPGLPTTSRARSSSVQLTRLHSKSEGMNEGTAAAALQRAIQSSPARFVGSQHVPIEVEDLTPKPTRRVLFPSPRKSGEMKVLQDQNESAIKDGTEPDLKKNTTIGNEPADKENLPPHHESDDLEHLFQEMRDDTSTPSSPTTLIKQSLNPFKTPTKGTPKNSDVLNTGDFFSSAAKAFLLPPCTPERNVFKPKSNGIDQLCSHQDLGELTPFTTHLNNLLSDANGANDHPSTPNPGSNRYLDFPSLPSLHADGGENELSSPSRLFVLQNHAGDDDNDFDFSTFDPGDLMSTDVLMPSSPPMAGWFGVYEDPIEDVACGMNGNGENSTSHCGGNEGWSELGLGSSPVLDKDEPSYGIDVKRELKEIANVVCSRDSEPKGEGGLPRKVLEIDARGRASVVSK